MSESINQEIQNELIEAVRSGVLASNLRPQAERLLARISDPVRLTILGLPESGKSTLANLLLGKSVLPEGNGLPTVQIKHGSQPKSICTLPDGSKKTFDHCDPKQIAAEKPILLEMEMPLAALGKISLMEVVASGNTVEQKRALLWASKRTDIALWCTQDFNSVEQDLWNGMPENLKDHAFLLITKADILANRGDLKTVQDRLNTLGGEEFKQVLSIETKDAVNARAADGSIDKQKLTDTGGRALVAAILRAVEQGKQAAFDQADILLRQHQQFMVPARQAIETKSETQIESVETAPVETKPAVEPKAAVEKPVPTEDSPPKPPAEAPKPAPEKEETAEVVELSSKNRATYSHAVSFLQKSGQELLEELEKNETLAGERIMEKTSESVLWLNDYLQDNGDTKDPQHVQMLDSTADASDLVQLLELEDAEKAPMDAISLIVQLKRDIETQLCA